MSSQIKIKICGHCKNEKLTPERRTALAEQSHDVHKKGCERFGTKFLVGNQAAIAAALDCEIDATDPRMRALLSIAVYRVMLLFVEEIKR